MSKTAIIIPARYGSSRLEGKPLLKVMVKSVIHWVYEKAQQAKLADIIIVATDDKRIYDEVKSFGGEVEMTSVEHKCGSDRIMEVVSRHPEISYICNLQGDEPLIKPESIDDVIRNVKEDDNADISTLIRVLTNEEEINNPVVILSGPSHAEEVAFDIPTTVLTSSNNMKIAEEVQDLFMTKTFRVYTNDDLIGVEVGGAVKNIIALAAGVCDGLGYGDNTKAALMTRGMAEIVRIGTKLGGRVETFLGLTGMGDLIVTCTSMHSRNRKAGYLIGKGKSREEAVEEVGMIVEGIKACNAFYNLKEKLNVEMPITDALYKVLFEGSDPREMVSKLLQRDKKSENY